MKRAISAILLLFISLTVLASCGANETDPAFTLDGKTYDMVLHGLNEYQHNIIVYYNNEKVYKAARFSKYLTNEEEGDPIFDTVIREDGTESKVYTVYVNFTDIGKGDSREAYVEFMDKYMTGENALIPMFGEDYEYEISEDFLRSIQGKSS